MSRTIIDTVNAEDFVVNGIPQNIVSCWYCDGCKQIGGACINYADIYPQNQEPSISFRDGVISERNVNTLENDGKYIIKRYKCKNEDVDFCFECMNDHNIKSTTEHSEFIEVIYDMSKYNCFFKPECDDFVVKNKLNVVDVENKEDKYDDYGNIIKIVRLRYNLSTTYTPYKKQALLCVPVLIDPYGMLDDKIYMEIIIKSDGEFVSCSVRDYFSTCKIRFLSFCLQHKHIHDVSEWDIDEQTSVIYELPSGGCSSKLEFGEKHSKYDVICIDIRVCIDKLNRCKDICPR